jgi:regulator of protease activity HflC (stomatin/prohibitin superfamily)
MVIPVPAGHAGVLWRRFLGGVQMNHVYGEGTHLIFPWDKMTIYNARSASLQIPTTMLTERGLEVSLTIYVRYHPNWDDLPKIHRFFGPDYENALIKPEVLGTFRRLMGRYLPDNEETVYGFAEARFSEYERKWAEVQLKGALFQLERCFLTHAALPDMVQKAVQLKITEQQNTYTTRFLQEQAEAEKKRMVTQAEGIARFTEITGGKVPYLEYRGILATEKLSASPNSKIVVLGQGKGGSPVLINPQ